MVSSRTLRMYSVMRVIRGPGRQGLGGRYLSSLLSKAKLNLQAWLPLLLAPARGNQWFVFNPPGTCDICSEDSFSLRSRQRCSKG